MTRSRPLGLPPRRCWWRSSALVAAGCGSSDGRPRRRQRPPAGARPRSASPTTAGSARSSSTHRAAPSTCSRRTRARRARAPAGAPRPGPRCARAASRRPAAARRRRCSARRRGPTESRRSPTTATRSTGTRATARPATPTARASTVRRPLVRAAPSGNDDHHEIVELGRRHQWLLAARSADAVEPVAMDAAAPAAYALGAVAPRGRGGRARPAVRVRVPRRAMDRAAVPGQRRRVHRRRSPASRTIATRQPRGAGRHRDLRDRARQPRRELRQGLFGWQEAGFRTPVALAMITEAGAVILLATALTLEPGAVVRGRDDVSRPRGASVTRSRPITLLAVAALLPLTALVLGVVAAAAARARRA